MGIDDTHDRYINPYTDFGFKKLFGTVINKELLISFLNALFSGREVVKDITYLNPEHLGSLELDRKAVFDVYCENEQGEKYAHAAKHQDKSRIKSIVQLFRAVHIPFPPLSAAAHQKHAKMFAFCQAFP